MTPPIIATTSADAASSVLYTVAQLRAIEQAAMTVLPAHTLMQRAGIAAATAARRLNPSAATACVLVLAGPGNNGGDALVAAAELADAGYAVSVLAVATASRPADAGHAMQRARACRITWIDTERIDDRWTLVIDGLFGIGMRRPLDAACRALVRRVNDLRCPILALDIASGLNADTGCVIVAGTSEASDTSATSTTSATTATPARPAAPDDLAINATHTITFIADKPGLHTCDGRDHSGIIEVADLGIDPAISAEAVDGSIAGTIAGMDAKTAAAADAHASLHPRPASPARARLSAPAMFAEYLRPRRQNSHKGSFGDVGILGGAVGMAGAVILAARAAAHCGAGRVYAGFIDRPPAYDALHPELMCRHATDLTLASGAIAVGPGLGTSRAAHDLLAQALHAAGKLVIDADALNLLAAEPSLREKIIARAQRQSIDATLLTPHPLEAARLLGIDAAAVQADRPQAARDLAARLQAIVILKGSGTIVAAPDGNIAINPTGNPALATAGSGDVLTGVCAALLAQGWPAWQAALAAVWLHGAAADLLVAQGTGPTGLTASELGAAIRLSLNQLIAKTPQ